MKKLLIGCVLYCLGTVSVVATDVFYSDYGEYNEWSKEEYKQTDTMEVEQKTQYHFYQKIETEGAYYLVGENEHHHPLLKEELSYTSSYTSWSEEVPLPKPGRMIDTRTAYYYRDMKEVRYVHFDQLLGGNGKLQVSEIVVRAGGEEIPYQVYCSSCSLGFDYFVQNKVMKENNSYVEENAYLRLDLNHYYPMSSLIVEVYLYDETNETKRLSIYFTREPSLENRIYMYVTQLHFFRYHSFEQIVPIIFTVDQLLYQNPEYGPMTKTYDPVFSSKTRSVEQKLEYRYQDTFYWYYNEQRQYIDGDYEDYPDYEKDESKMETYYRYRIRDKIEIPKKMEIHSYDQTIFSLITSTTNDIKTIGSINYFQNGYYEVIIRFPFGEVSRVVEVANKENTIRLLKEELLLLTGVISEKDKLLSQWMGLKQSLKENNQEMVFEKIVPIENSLLPESKNKEEKNTKYTGNPWVMIVMIILIISHMIQIYKISRIKNSSSFVESV